MRIMSFDELLQTLKTGRTRVTIRPAPPTRPRDFSVAHQSAVDHAKRLAFVADWGSGEVGISRQQADQLLAEGAIDKAGLRPES